MFGSCLSKLDGEMLPLRFGFNNMFHGIFAFFKHNFCLVPRWKINWPRWISFFLCFPAEIFEFGFNPRCKIGWPPGHWDRVSQCFFIMKKVIFKSSKIASSLFRILLSLIFFVFKALSGVL